MKLTKGKLSKLFHKKKQTMRRYKNQRKYRRASKTFRQRKPLNLHRSSMKKIERVGGADTDEKVPLVVKPASDEASITTTESITEPLPQPVPEPMSEPVPEQMSDPVPEQMSEPVSEPVVVVEEPMSEPVSEPVVVEEPIPDPVAEEPLAKPVEEPIVAENVNPEPASTPPPSVADALNIIADKIATAVVTKMRENPTMGSYPNQDADIAVPLAVSAVVKQTQLAPE